MMKKYLLLGLTLFLCLAVQPVMAQLQDERHNFSIGVNGGVNISSVSFMPRIREGKQIGPSFGLTARYISEKYFSMICGIQMELNYSQRGWKEVYEDETGDTYHRTMNYLELPILAHLAFGKDEGNGRGGADHDGNGAGTLHCVYEDLLERPPGHEPVDQEGDEKRVQSGDGAGLGRGHDAGIDADEQDDLNQYGNDETN